MVDIITSGEHAVGEGERKTERDLGAIINEVEHLAEIVAEHTVTINGVKEDLTWTREHLEALKRDAEALPAIPNTLAEAIADLSTRQDRLEARHPHEEETKAPERDESRDDRESEPDRSEPRRLSWIDRIT